MRLRDITPTELKIGALLYPERNYWRPTKRSDCENVIRPCPFVSCRANNYLDVTKAGSIILNYPGLEPWEVPAGHSCTLDRAEDPHTLEEVGAVMNLTRERIRQIELIAFSKLDIDEIAGRG